MTKITAVAHSVGDSSSDRHEKNAHTCAFDSLFAWTCVCIKTSHLRRLETVLLRLRLRLRLRR